MARSLASVLSDGTHLPADLVLLGVGVRPNIGLAQDAGLVIGASGGIATDDWMRTSDPDIYAVGDAAEYAFGVTGAAHAPARSRVPPTARAAWPASMPPPARRGRLPPPGARR